MTISGERLDAVVADAVAGDRDALREVLEIVRPIVVRYCRARLGTAERSGLSADDVAQEVCLAAITALPRYRDQGRPFLAFVYGIAAHKVADAHRAAARNRADPTDVVPERLPRRPDPSRWRWTGEASERMNALLPGPAGEAARDPDLARGRRPERRGDSRSGRQLAGRSAGRAAPGAEPAARARSWRIGARRCLISVAGMRRRRPVDSTRSCAPTASSMRWPPARGVAGGSRLSPNGSAVGRLARQRAPAAGRHVVIVAAATPRWPAAQKPAVARPATGSGWQSSVRSPPRCCASAGSARSSTAPGPATRSTGCATCCSASRRRPATTRSRWRRSELAQVQQLVEQGQLGPGAGKAADRGPHRANRRRRAAAAAAGRAVQHAAGQGRSPRSAGHRRPVVPPPVPDRRR